MLQQVSFWLFLVSQIIVFSLYLDITWIARNHSSFFQYHQ